MSILLAVEDLPSELIIRKCINSLNPNVNITGILQKRGKTYLHEKRNNLNRSAHNMNVLLLVDLDNQTTCPAQEKASWFPNGTSKGLIFRVAVLEVEAWLLASRTKLAAYFGVRGNLIPVQVELINDPKGCLINLARVSRYPNIREDIVPDSGSTAKVGRNYNGRILHFIENYWDITEALANSRSLRKLSSSIQTL